MNFIRGIRKFRFLLAFIFLYCLEPNICFSGNLEVANGFFYNHQYEKAISFFVDALGSENYDKSTKTSIKYKIGLAYFLLGDQERSLKYWVEARQEDPGIFDGKIYRIPAASMEPQLIIGDHIIIDNEYYRHKEIKRGDVVVFLSPKEPRNVYIKRVIALPGEKIQIKKKEVFINNLKLFDKNANFTDTEGFESKRDDFAPVVVPEKSYFLLGDSRDQSFDSRFFGPVPQELIMGKALVIYSTVPNKFSLEGASMDRAGKIIK